MMITISIAINNFFLHWTTRTKISRLHSVCLFIVLLSFLPACTDKELYVQTEVLSLRTEPSESASVTSQLRINTRVRVWDKQNGWVDVSGLGLHGWAPRSQFAKKPLTLDEAVKKAQSAAGAEKVAWLERAVAVDGSKESVWRLLLAASEEAGLKDKARHARDFLDGRVPVHIAICYNGAITLLGTYSPTSGLKKLLAADDLAAAKQLSEATGLKLVAADDLAAAKRLSVATWYRSDQDIPLQGTPFPDPSIREVGQLPDQGIDYTMLYLDMGECPKNGGIYATAPIIAVSPATVEDTAANQAVREVLRAKTDVSEFTSLTLRRFFDAPVFHEVTFEGKSSGDVPWLGWLLVDNKYQPILNCDRSNEPGAFPLTLRNCIDDPWLKCTANIKDFSWVQLRFGPRVRIGVRRWYQGETHKIDEDIIRNSIAGFWLVLVNESGCARAFEMETWVDYSEEVGGGTQN